MKDKWSVDSETMMNAIAVLVGFVQAKDKQLYWGTH